MLVNTTVLLLEYVLIAVVVYELIRGPCLPFYLFMAKQVFKRLVISGNMRYTNIMLLVNSFLKKGIK